MFVHPLIGFAAGFAVVAVVIAVVALVAVVAVAVVAVHPLIDQLNPGVT